MTHQEQEHIDHVAGSASEFQNSFAQSQIEHHHANIDTVVRIAELVEAGRFVVVGSCPAYCRVTDAVVGEHVNIEADFATRAEAEAHCARYTDLDDDFRVRIEPVAARLALAQAIADEAESHGIDMDDDIPF